MLLADARLPTGGHAHSAGLEPALAAGLASSDIRAMLIGRAQTTSLVDAATSVAIRHLVQQTDSRCRPLPRDLRDDAPTAGIRAALTQTQRAWAARTPSQAMRDASRALGRGYSRLAARLWPTTEIVLILRSTIDRPARPVVLGVIAAASGLSAADLVRLSVYDDAQTAAAALLKLRPGDPADASALVLEVCASAEPFVAQIAATTTADAIPAFAAPQFEGWAEAHALLDRKLFRA